MAAELIYPIVSELGADATRTNPSGFDAALTTINAIASEWDPASL